MDRRWIWPETSAAEAVEAERPGLLGVWLGPGVVHEAMAEPAREHRLLHERCRVSGIGNVDGAGCDSLVEKFEEQGGDRTHRHLDPVRVGGSQLRSEEHTSEL